MLSLQNRASDIKLLKLHTNRDYSTYLEKYNFSMEASLSILILPLDLWHRNEFEGGLKF